MFGKWAYLQGNLCMCFLNVSSWVSGEGNLSRRYNALFKVDMEVDASIFRRDCCSSLPTLLVLNLSVLQCLMPFLTWWWPPTITLLSLLIHNYKLATVINCNKNKYLVFFDGHRWLPWKGCSITVLLLKCYYMTINFKSRRISTVKNQKQISRPCNPPTPFVSFQKCPCVNVYGFIQLNLYNFVARLHHTMMSWRYYIVGCT